MELDARLRELADGMGADFFGVADLSPARDAILAQGGPAIAAFPRAVSMGIALMHSIVDLLPERANRSVAMDYRYHCYDLVNQRLDHIASRLSGMLQREGYRAMPVPASQTVDGERLAGVFSHKLAARLAGLGWIGRSCLLVTPEVGPRVRWATVLTNAPLSPARELMEVQCDDCQRCVDICPVGAFTGQVFRAEEPREARFDARKCKSYLDEVERTTGISVCGMCLYACRFGRERRAAGVAKGAE